MRRIRPFDAMVLIFGGTLMILSALLVIFGD